MNDTTLLEARDVCVKLGRKRVLRDVSLSIPMGSVTALLGRNGAGKSTLLDCCLGLRPVNSGELTVFGRDPWRDGARIRSDVGYVEADPIFDQRERVGHVLAFHRRVRKTWRRETEDQLLETMKMPLDRRVRDLSRGMRTKLALLIALATSPRLLVLDEPFDGLDVGARDEILAEVVRHVDDARTILLASHDLDEVERVADRLCILDAGRVIHEGDPESFLASRRRFTARVADGVVWPKGVSHDAASGRSIVIVDGAESARQLLEGHIDGVDVLDEVPVRDLKEAFLLATSGMETES